MAAPIITLTTDYGTSDHLVGTVKGVVLNINADAKLVDISHNVAAHDVLDGALVIAGAYRYFPPRTIHVVIVDPGVGTQRRPLLVTGEHHYFIAPDNGVLSLVYDREPRLEVRQINAEHYFLNPVSNTFHGRDVFAPIAGWLSKTFQAPTFGEEISDFVRFRMPKPKAAGGALKGVVLRIDNFGNLMTNFSAEDLPPGTAPGAAIKLLVGNKEVQRFAENYAQGPAGEPFAIMGSSGFLEIAVNKGNAARLLGVPRGSEITLQVPESAASFAGGRPAAAGGSRSDDGS